MPLTGTTNNENAILTVAKDLLVGPPASFSNGAR